MMGDTTSYLQAMNTYEILHDEFRDDGPFSLEDIKRLTESGEIGLEQEVLKSGEEKSVSADYALIFYDEAADGEDAIPNGSAWKKYLGSAICLMGLVVMGMVVHAFTSDRSISRSQVMVGVVLTLAGIKIFQMGIASKE